MQVSDVDEIEKQMRRATSLNIQDDDLVGEAGSRTGFEFDEISAVTLPSLQEYHILDWSKPAEEEKKATSKSLRRKIQKEEEMGFDFNAADMRSNEARASVVPLEVKVKLAKAAEAKKKLRKAFLPEDPEFYKPNDVVILCFGMITGHDDLHLIEKETANKWLHIWDDGSRRFKALVQRGVSIAGL
jgi:hypothetical protein